MKLWFRRNAESELGEGVVYLETEEGWPCRQVEVYGDVWRWGDKDHPQWLADQPLDVLELGEEYAISAGDFERVWEEALLQCPSDS